MQFLIAFFFLCGNSGYFPEQLGGTGGNGANGWAFFTQDVVINIHVVGQLDNQIDIGLLEQIIDR